MAGARFYLSIDGHGLCEGFSTGARSLGTRDGALCIAQIDLPLPPGSADATVRLAEQASPPLAPTATLASAWLALDDTGGCHAYAGECSGLTEVREAAERNARDTGLAIAVVRLDVPLPAGHAPARVSLI